MKTATIHKFLFTVIFLSTLSACISGNRTPALDPTQGAQLLAGKYTTTITADDVQKANSLDPSISSNQGTWELALTSDGKFFANNNGQFVASGNFTVRGQSMEVYVQSVCTDCGCGQGIGKFNWALQEDKLYFTKTAGVCDGMDLLLTAHPLTKKP